MFRYKFTIEYDGSAAEVGWQLQPDKVSIQSILSEAAFKLSQSHIIFHGAGRTDKGVHAYGQVAHADFLREYPLVSLKRGINFHLGDHKVAIQNVEPVPNDFHARFEAKMKTYRYDICIRDYPNVLSPNNWRMVYKLNIDEMRNAAQFLLGKHDFTSFRDNNCQALSAERSIDEINFEVKRDIISIYFIARSFLHHQIRIMVGTLVDVGLGRKNSDIRNIISSKSRDLAGPTAPANGLFLEKIEYSI
ncbi:tRNA pseudouridine(38-40) synthase TruA [Candidatus Cytomitobacter primus]|uniref:tRNA pseudouridine synthase A n=1 Tax=Candidatus Cytomitobacter primus TaxID=2066024 RepID=A0A5C0UE62_9PROT|nr:tRNA pseudouridine(38-40) synthase TruA [Candidatus Cytomitobacter primus]QEK38376.1 tRNA pseudouridine(38-40) synthase TruA [Candidatus Cytomitobacter primus]